MDTQMFCYQCEQTAKGEACTVKGVCGKDAEVANLQDDLVCKLKILALYAHRARQLGAKDAEIDKFVPAALFTTLTNVNFAPEDHREMLSRADSLIDRARALYQNACGQSNESPEDLTGRVDKIKKQHDAIPPRMEAIGDDITGLQELLLYGMKGMAAYTDHARVLGVEDDDVYAYYHAKLDFLSSDEAEDADRMTAECLGCGEMNLKVMGMLDQANTGAYGHPEPTQARISPVKGKAILVSGHDLKDLKMLLEQTEGTGINVYTHGEMLPCLAYPELKKYDHLVGNYGGAWQDQQHEFADFPGAILMTTNCLMAPRESYADRIFSTSVVGFTGMQHIAEEPDGTKDFTPVIEAAKAAGGFTEDAPEKTITIGFGHNAVMGVADKVVEAVKGGNIRHFFLIGGCDGAKPGRNYYTEFAEQVPDDCVILTLACGKYRFNKMPFGDIGGIPRLLDCGQCNDAYSAIQIASSLAEAFDCGVNDLPLSMILSWFEQKAVVILLTLLHLGIRDMRLGPTLPAFITPNVLNVLVEKFGIKPIGTPKEDLQTILQPA